MKKLITLSIAFTFLGVNVSSANYVLYYKSSQYSNWVKGPSYSDFAQCENARKYSYSWFGWYSNSSHWNNSFSLRQLGKFLY